MNYYDLLEQNTDDAAIQFQLYLACKNGEGGGEEEARQWLQRAADNGHEEAIALLKAETDAPQQAADRYATMSSLELLEVADESYAASRELYRRNQNATDRAMLLDILKKLCNFDDAVTEDYEALMRVYFCPEYLNNPAMREEIVTACQNAMEMGSEQAKHYLLNLYSGYVYPDDGTTYYNLSESVARSGDYTDKFCHFVMLYSAKFKNVEQREMYKRAWFDELMKAPDAQKYPVLYYYLQHMGEKGAVLSKLEDYVVSQTAYSPQTAAAVLALSVFAPRSERLEEAVQRLHIPEHCEFPYAFMIVNLQRAAEEQSFNAAKEQYYSNQPYTRAPQGQNANGQPVHKDSVEQAIDTAVEKVKPVAEKGVELLKTNRNARIIAVAVAVLLVLIILISAISHGHAKKAVNKSANNTTTTSASAEATTEKTTATTEPAVTTLDLFQYVDVTFSGTPGRVRIDLKSNITKETQNGYAIENITVNDKATVGFNIEDATGKHIETYSVSVDRDSISWFDENEVRYYDLQENGSINLKCSSQMYNDDIEYKELSTVKVTGLDKLVTEAAQIKAEDVEKLNSEMLDVVRTEQSNTTAEGLYLIKDPINEHYTTAVVKVESYLTEYGYYRYYYAYIYNPAIGAGDNLTEDSFENIHMKNESEHSDHDDVDVDSNIRDLFKCTKVEKID